jgi:hypothetical protein
MKTKALLITLVVLAALVLSGCKALGLTTPEPVAVELSETFTSPRFGYTVSYPTGWITDEKSGPWLDFQGLNPLFSRASGYDRFTAYVDGVNIGFGIAARETAIDGADLAAVEATATDLLDDGAVYLCADLQPPTPGPAEPITIGGEEGILMSTSCSSATDGFYAVALTIHNGMVYWFVLGSTPANSADTGLLTQILETVEFTN